MPSTIVSTDAPFSVLSGFMMINKYNDAAGALGTAAW